MQECPLSIHLPTVHTETPAFTTACPEICEIMAHNKEHTEHYSFFTDSIQLYFCKTGVSIQLKKSYGSAALYMFLWLNMTSNRQCPEALIQ